MSKLQHTSGPWNEDGIYVILRYADKHDMDIDESDKVMPFSTSDARLIAAAPEMLIELLKSIAELDKTGFASITAETIIMKATGWSYDILDDVLTKLSTGMSIEEILK
jgi:hypothetical protein